MVWWSVLGWKLDAMTYHDDHWIVLAFSLKERPDELSLLKQQIFSHGESLRSNFWFRHVPPNN